MLNSNQWTREEAITLCVMVEMVCPPFGVHVALTGGLLYKVGPRKDCDLVFYRIRQCKEIDFNGLFQALEGIGFSQPIGFGWIFKSQFRGLRVDLLFPEEAGGEYPKPNEA